MRPACDFADTRISDRLVPYSKSHSSTALATLYYFVPPYLLDLRCNQIRSKSDAFRSRQTPCLHPLGWYLSIYKLRPSQQLPTLAGYDGRHEESFCTAGQTCTLIRRLV